MVDELKNEKETNDSAKQEAPEKPVKHEKPPEEQTSPDPSEVETPITDDTEKPASVPAAQDQTKEPEQKEGEEEEKIPYKMLESGDKPGSVRFYKVEVSWEEYDTRQEKMLRDLKKEVLIDGFRKGKAPVSLIKIRFRKEIEQDILNEIYSKVIEEILKEEDYTKFSDPELKESKVEASKPLELLIELEVLPKIDIKKEDYTGGDIVIKREKVTDELVEESLANLQKNSAYFEPKEKGPVEKEDGVVLNIEVDDERGMELKELRLQNEFIQNPGEGLPGEIYKELLGKEKGARFEVEIPFERKNPRSEVYSKKDTWKVAILEIKKRILPDLDDEFAKDVGEFESLQDLRSTLRENLEKRIKTEAEENAFSTLVDQLIEKTSFDPPGSLVEKSKQGMIQREIQLFQRMGFSLQDLAVDSEEFQEKKEKDAVKSLKSSLLLHEVVTKEKLEISEDALQAALKEIAGREGRKPLAIRARLEREGQLEHFKENLLTEKVKKFLLENNKVTYEEEK